MEWPLLRRSSHAEKALKPDCVVGHITGDIRISVLHGLVARARAPGRPIAFAFPLAPLQTRGGPRPLLWGRENVELQMERDPAADGPWQWTIRSSTDRIICNRDVI
ncbi:hypothetical protein CPLU01_06448 [Colletotrichum plurivorum]|uniref:Uncharacterized protein n=1 Tax=Colletotrichum plurivorum TaxID=2175906 RepID=A0A8H6NGS2_9PEZI|nr:hypothetical protein CPLU01_06448 [Colletotrichum plurivorum]